MDIDGFLEALDILSKDTIKTHMRNIKRLDETIDVYDKPNVNIKILYWIEKRLPTLMSLYKTLLNYLNFMGINTTEYNEEYDKIKKNMTNLKRKTRGNYCLEVFILPMIYMAN